MGIYKAIGGGVMSNKCELCTKKINLLTTHVMKGKHLCVDCYMKEKAKGDDAFLETIPNFTVTQKYINRTRQDGIVVDEVQKEIAFFRYRDALLNKEEKMEEVNRRIQEESLSIIDSKKSVEDEQRAYVVDRIKYLFDYDVFDFEKILEIELVENGHTIKKLRRKYIQAERLLREIHYGEIDEFIGLPILKEKGSEVAYQLGLKIIVNSWSRPVFYVDFFNRPGSEIKKTSDVYQETLKLVNFWYDFIEDIIKNSDLEDLEKPTENDSNDFYEVLLKLDKLRKNDIITEEEFLNKKKEILEKI